MNFWHLILELFSLGIYSEEKTLGAVRSSRWPTVRKNFLGNKPCALCCGMDKREVHHKKSFKEHPELELDETNLIVLCESKKWGITCHQFFGHLGDYKRINNNVEADVKIWNEKLTTRP